MYRSVNIVNAMQIRKHSLCPADLFVGKVDGVIQGSVRNVYFDILTFKAVASVIRHKLVIIISASDASLQVSLSGFYFE